VLAVNPFDQKVSQTLGNAALQLGHEELAILAYEGVGLEGVEKPDLSALRSLGVLYQRKGEFEKSLSCFEKVLKIDPNDAEAARARKNLAAEMAIKTSRLDSATSSRDLIKDKKKAQELEDAQRLTLTDEERDRAVAEAEEALSRSPSDKSAAL